MRRFDIREISPHRIFSGLIRRVQDIPHSVAWWGATHFVNPSRHRALDFANRHEGQRCFILANGPSLATMNLSPLAGEITFGLNRIYLLFDRLPFKPTYFACVNELVLEQFSDEIGQLPMPKFLNWNRRKLFNADDPSTNFVKLSLGLHDLFGQEFAQPLFSGGTVTYVALQIAYIMGFSEVILIGLDHSFADKGTPNIVEVRRDDKDANHFHPDYFPKGSKWQLPDLRRSELAYELGRNTFESDGRKIRDATINGKCFVFEKVSFTSLF